LGGRGVVGGVGVGGGGINLNISETVKERSATILRGDGKKMRCLQIRIPKGGGETLHPPLCRKEIGRKVGTKWKTRIKRKWKIKKGGEERDQFMVVFGQLGEFTAKTSLRKRESRFNTKQSKNCGEKLIQVQGTARKGRLSSWDMAVKRITRWTMVDEGTTRGKRKRRKRYMKTEPSPRAGDVNPDEMHLTGSHHEGGIAMAKSKMKNLRRDIETQVFEKKSIFSFGTVKCKGSELKKGKLHLVHSQRGESRPKLPKGGSGEKMRRGEV